MPKRTLFLILGLIVVTTVLLFVAFQLNQSDQQQQPPQAEQPESPTPTPPTFTTLELSPNPVSLNPDGTGSVDVVIDTNQNTISGIQLEIGYDPATITDVVVTPGQFFSDPLIIPQWENIDEATGRISHAQVLTPAQESVSGEGVVATITFRRAPGATSATTELTFLPKTAVTQAGVSDSVIQSATGATVELGQVQGQTIQTVPLETQPTQQAQ